jgi:hypothetical protein
VAKRREVSVNRCARTLVLLWWDLGAVPRRARLAPAEATEFSLSCLRFGNLPASSRR